jgi:hypothetical protein
MISEMKILFADFGLTHFGAFKNGSPRCTVEPVAYKSRFDAPLGVLGAYSRPVLTIWSKDFRVCGKNEYPRG